MANIAAAIKIEPKQFFRYFSNRKSSRGGVRVTIEGKLEDDPQMVADTFAKQFMSNINENSCSYSTIINSEGNWDSFLQTVFLIYLTFLILRYLTRSKV